MKHNTSFTNRLRQRTAIIRTLHMASRPKNNIPFIFHAAILAHVIPEARR
jgi:hypothetical protein